MAKKGLEPKTIGLIGVVVVAVALAIWQASHAMSPAASDPSFKTSKPAPPESARPPGFEKPGQVSSDKT